MRDADVGADAGQRRKAILELTIEAGQTIDCVSGASGIQMEDVPVLSLGMPKF